MSKNSAAVIVLLLIIVAAYKSALQESFEAEKLEYRGDEIYKAVKDFKKLSSKGFMIEAEISGRFIGDPTERRVFLKGVVYKAGGGSLFLRLKDGTTLAVGGTMAYREDVAAEDIVFIPLYESVAKYHFIFKNTTLHDLINKIKNLKSKNEKILISGFIVPKNVSSLKNFLKSSNLECYYCVDAKVVNGYLYVDLILIEELEKIQNMGIDYANVNVYLGKECIGVKNEICIENIL